MGEGEAEGGTVFCLKGGEEEVVFLFLFFSCAVYSQVWVIHHHLQHPLNFFSGIIFSLLSFALYLPSKLETAYHHTHTLSLSDGIQFLLFSSSRIPSRLYQKREKKLLYPPQLPPCNLIPMPKAA